MCERRIDDIAARGIVVAVTGDELVRLIEEDLSFVGQLQAGSVGCHVFFKYRSMHRG